ncbi:hypothetical protein M3P05_19225 [Sansalvadorimonas sp. 2012CJ34-2]|uniref:Uncharacterized protein n=1 Tax=Parendozoicomonas callyspongiae TaxID=2942213 RepID=A0ABT0PL13_9GAMM|nr:hypothetical protein [Sansalvadorimonas sp. 2012CJ34-2]MCL6272058.1 hypothetical protein [Sansalvadorimonas sp. 2012CJ34-2]
MSVLPYLTMLGSILAFLFGVWKYLDTKKAEERNKRFEQFRQVFVWFSGRDEKGEALTAVQQAVATYQLSEFPEYKEMSLPIIEELLEKTIDEDPQSLFRKALLHVHEQLSSE